LTEEGGNVPAAELESAARELDERTYRQEYQASFENVGSGIVYYGFDRGGNVEIVEYDPKHQRAPRGLRRVPDGSRGHEVTPPSRCPPRGPDGPDGRVARVGQ
jgi:hypothetical protein